METKVKISRLTPEYFSEVKRYVRWHTTNRTAKKFGISIKTALQVRGSNNYGQYRENVKAQHPETKYSLADDVLALHKTVFDKGGEYHTPKTAQTAITQLNYELAKK
jgi:hypothetical protein